MLNYLTEEIDLQQVVQPTMRPNLEVISIGKPATQILSPFDLLKFATFLEEVRTRYDFVLFDRPLFLVPVIASLSQPELTGSSL